jgi:rhodanese-related sulfurtransferase
MLSEGAILVDIRDPDEHARERIAAARACLSPPWSRRILSFTVGSP